MLRIGSTLPVFGRVIFIYACDAATRSFFKDVDSPQPDDLVPEHDVYTAAKAKSVGASDWFGTRSSTITRFLEASLGSSRDMKKDSKTRFIKYDGVKLRFLLLWKYQDGTKQEAFKYW
jgi:hypothetical protein